MMTLLHQPGRANGSVAAEEVHFVPLERLPPGLQFPGSLVERLWFDSNRKRLAFRGFMSKAVYDRLAPLSNDSAYQRALEELFRVSVYDGPAQRRRPLDKLLPIAALVIVALLAAALALPLRLLAMR